MHAYMYVYVCLCIHTYLSMHVAVYFMVYVWLYVCLCRYVYVVCLCLCMAIAMHVWYLPESSPTNDCDVPRVPPVQQLVNLTARHLVWNGNKYVCGVCVTMILLRL